MSETVYLHRITLALYPVAVYGARDMLIVDPEWLAPEGREGAEAPLVSVPNPNCQLPPGAELIELSADEYELLKGAAGAGKIIGIEDDGPVLLDPPPPSAEVLKANELAWRNVAMSQTESLIARHRDELDAGAATTLTADEFKQLQQYRLSLRAWPDAVGFPDAFKRPAPPDWLAAQL
ncbi:MAG TPA: phage tail protein [Pseudomonas sp.]|uniref:phage tail protein n=1 Tax=Pseudomonas sp. TaxID=306 RepID=UPI002EDA2B6A